MQENLLTTPTRLYFKGGSNDKKKSFSFPSKKFIMKSPLILTSAYEKIKKAILKQKKDKDAPETIDLSGVIGKWAHPTTPSALQPVKERDSGDEITKPCSLMSVSSSLIIDNLTAEEQEALDLLNLHSLEDRDAITNKINQQHPDATDDDYWAKLLAYLKQDPETIKLKELKMLSNSDNTVTRSSSKSSTSSDYICRKTATAKEINRKLNRYPPEDRAEINKNINKRLTDLLKEKGGRAVNVLISDASTQSFSSRYNNLVMQVMDDWDKAIGVNPRYPNHLSEKRKQQKIDQRLDKKYGKKEQEEMVQLAIEKTDREKPSSNMYNKTYYYNLESIMNEKDSKRIPSSSSATLVNDINPFWASEIQKRLNTYSKEERVEIIKNALNAERAHRAKTKMPYNHTVYYENLEDILIKREQHQKASNETSTSILQKLEQCMQNRLATYTPQEQDDILNRVYACESSSDSIVYDDDYYKVHYKKLNQYMDELDLQKVSLNR